MTIMESEQMISVDDFCIHHRIEVSFIHSLKERGMIDTVDQDSSLFLPASQLELLEKILTLHFELEINLEGIETITYLLERIKAMQHQIDQLNKRLSVYEDR